MADGAVKAVARPRARRDKIARSEDLSTIGKIQRRRILEAIVEVVAERGVARTTVELVIVRAGVSRRTFYDCFDGLQECLTVVMDRALERLEMSMRCELTRADHWLDGVRNGLGTLLGVFDREPGLARVCFVDALAAGPAVLAYRERRIYTMTMAVAVELGVDPSGMPPFTVQSIVALVFGAIHARLVEGEPESLLLLLGPCMGVIAGLRLDMRDAVQEIERSEALVREMLARPAPAHGSPRAPRGSLGQVPDRLRRARAHRARLCLRYVAAHPGKSNREVGEGIGVAHGGHVSMLLRRLAEQGLVCKHSAGLGLHNAWSATLEGERVALALAEHEQY